MYNAALFRIRNVFTGYRKEHRTENEAGVFAEVDLMQTVYPGKNVRKVITYYQLEKLMRVTHNQDFFAGLPMQTAQAVVKILAKGHTNKYVSFRQLKTCRTITPISSKISVIRSVETSSTTA